jgi:predicted RNA-binding Zn-ribbon protein involved in translation (DUF1610 family)
VNSLREIWGTLKQIRHAGPRPKFCPNCKGHEIFPETIFGILPTTYKCRDCGYIGPFVLELDTEENDAIKSGKMVI